MKNVMEMFETETQLMLAESVYDVAMKRMREKNLDIEFSENLWNSIALTVIEDGYEAAKDYARNATFATAVAQKQRELSTSEINAVNSVNRIARNAH